MIFNLGWITNGARRNRLPWNKKKIGDEEETKQTWVSEWVWCVPERNPSLCKQDGAWPVQSPLILDLVTSAYQQPGSH